MLWSGRCYLVIATLLVFLTSRRVSANEEDGQESPFLYQIPNETLSPFGSYPNVLNISDNASFHPIVKFPKQCWNSNSKKFICSYSDYSVPQNYTSSQLLAFDAFDRSIRRIPLLAKLRRLWHSHILRFQKGKRYFGRYDEDRVNLYDTSLFKRDKEPRTVHVGIDLAGYVGTPVYSFDTGIVHAVGYNPAHGDYGNVVIVEYHTDGSSSVFYVLYGHLDEASRKLHTVGDTIFKGGIVGWMGDPYENGGWTSPHVHVQISTMRPVTHDLPGAVRRQDRERALIIYPDPRYIVGELY